MGITKKLIHAGNGKVKPVKGDEVTIDFTGNLYDSQFHQNNCRGEEFDSTAGRGPFKTKIGVGAVIRGWDEGVLEMCLGETAILTISADYAYGSHGFPGLIPPNSKLVFLVELKAIN